MHLLAAMPPSPEETPHLIRSWHCWGQFRTVYGRGSLNTVGGGGYVRGGGVGGWVCGCGCGCGWVGGVCVCVGGCFFFAFFIVWKASMIIFDHQLIIKGVMELCGAYNHFIYQNRVAALRHPQGSSQSLANCVTQTSFWGGMSQTKSFTCIICSY